MPETPAKTESEVEGCAASTGSVVGHWRSVAESMPDDDVTCLVWSDTLDDATLAFHDSEVLGRRGDSGWIIAGTARVVLGVTHWCEDIFPPNDKEPQPEPKDL